MYIHTSIIRLSSFLSDVDFSFSDSSYSGSEGGSFIIVTVEKAGETNFLASVILQSSSGTAVGMYCYSME